MVENMKQSFPEPPLPPKQFAPPPHLTLPQSYKPYHHPQFCFISLKDNRTHKSQAFGLPCGLYVGAFYAFGQKIFLGGEIVGMDEMCICKLGKTRMWRFFKSIGLLSSKFLSVPIISGKIWVIGRVWVEGYQMRSRSRLSLLRRNGAKP